MTEIETLLFNQNPQWTDSKWLPEENSWFRRDATRTIQKWIKKRFATTITGMRRTGKSTILKQLISDLIKKDLRNNIFYFSFEKLSVKPEPLLILKLINLYLDSILRKKPYEIKEKVYFFLDEIQNIPFWQNSVKSLYDLNPNFKFIISGSNSLFIKKRSEESLAGRMIDVKINPLSFSEFLRMKNKNLFHKINNKTWVAANMGIINSLFEEYLKKGQFPEIIKEKLSSEDAEKYLLSIEDKIIRQDLVKVFPVNYPEILAMVFEIIKRGVGQRIEYQKIALEAGIDQRTIMKYFEFLQYGFLINLCYNWGAKKPIRPLRRVKKGYLTSTNFSENADASRLVENYVYNYLFSQYADVYFQKDPEIDFLISTDNNEIFLLEIKYQNQIRKEDCKNISSFKSKEPINKFLITKTDFAKKDEISYLPASLIEFHHYF